MKKIILLVGLAVVLVVPLAACSKLPFQKTTSIAAPTTADVTRGTIEITVTSSGTINLPNKTQMGFSGSLTGSGAGNAILKELNVSPGTSVKQGQVIARMDTAGIERDLQRYRNSLETAKLNLDKAKEPAKATDITKAEASVTSAKSSLDFARDDLEDAKKPYTDNDFRVAEAAVRNAKTALAVAESQLEISKKDWDISYQSEMREIFQVSTPGRISGTLSAGLLGLLPGQGVVPQTEQQLKLVEELGLLIKQTELSISQSENSIVKARDTLAAAEYALSEMLSKKDGDPLTIKQKERSILNAEVSLQNAEINLAQLKEPPDPLDLRLREIQLEAAQLALDEAMQGLDESTIIAPFDGVIGDFTATVGDSIKPSSFLIPLVDTKEVRVNAFIEEFDVLKVRPGMPVTISLDALPEQTFRGVVGTISPLSSSAQGIVRYAVTITVQPQAAGGAASGTRPGAQAGGSGGPPAGVTPGQGGSGTGGSRRSAAGSIQGPVELKDGLTATASIVINSKQDVVLVPNRALVRKGQNQLVQVLVNGQKVDRPVKVGLVNDRVTEITEGLEAGESVVIQTPTSSTTQQGLPGGAQRMIGGIGR